MLPNSADLSEPSVARAREGAPRQCCGIWRSLSTRPRSWLRSTGAVVPSSPRTGISLKWNRRRWPAAAAPSRRLEPVGLLGAAAAAAQPRARAREGNDHDQRFAGDVIAAAADPKITAVLASSGQVPSPGGPAEFAAAVA